MRIPLVTEIAVGITLLAGTAPASGQAISDAEATRIVAASPLRELHRAWSQCIDEALFVANINAMASVTQIEAIVNFGCEGYESRLTGELIKQLGYNRGNAVLSSLKRGNRRRFQAQIDRQAAKPKNYYSEAGDWIIDKNARGQCQARNSDHSLIEPQMSWIVQDGPGWRLIFAKNVNYASRYRDRVGAMAQAIVTTLRMLTIANSEPIDSFDASLRFEVGKDFIGWSLPLGDATLAKLNGADKISFHAMTELQLTARSFPVRGMREALAQVKECSVGTITKV